MLNSAYDLMLSDAMNDLQEQVKVEHVPAEKNEQGVAVSIKAHEILNLNQSYNRYILAEH